MVLGTGIHPEQSWSQSRNSFPGRRVGGGTRGECVSRLIVHLVPESSVFAPGKEGVIGWLEGPSRDPKPIEISLLKRNKPVFMRSIVSSGPRLVLLRLLQTQLFPIVWESAYRCAESQAGDEFGFIGVESPPAKSLLVDESRLIDSAVQDQLKELLLTCDSKVPLSKIKLLFGLEDVINSQWPQEVPVMCF